MTGKPTRSRTKQFLIDFLLAANDPLLSLLALLPNLRPGILSAAPLDRLVILRSLSSVSFPNLISAKSRSGRSSLAVLWECQARGRVLGRDQTAFMLSG